MREGVDKREIGKRRFFFLRIFFLFSTRRESDVVTVTSLPSMLPLCRVATVLSSLYRREKIEKKRFFFCTGARRRPRLRTLPRKRFIEAKLISTKMKNDEIEKMKKKEMKMKTRRALQGRVGGKVTLRQTRRVIFFANFLFSIPRSRCSYSIRAPLPNPIERDAGFFGFPLFPISFTVNFHDFSFVFLFHIDEDKPCNAEHFSRDTRAFGFALEN